MRAALQGRYTQAAKGREIVPATTLESGGIGMAETDLDELGPIDYLVVEFPGSKFNGKIGPALVDLVDRGVIRVLDLVIVKKDDDGTLEAFEIGDLDETEAGSLLSYETELAMLLSAD